MGKTIPSMMHKPQRKHVPSNRQDSPWTLSLKKFLHQPVSVIAAVASIIVLLVAVAGTFRYTAAQKPNYNALLQPPSFHHLFGTDEFGRDIFDRVLVGAHLSIEVGLASVALGALMGTTLGLLAGYYSGWRASLIMRMTDVLLAFPGILLAIGVIAVLGGGILNVIFAVAVFTLPIFVRLVQGSTLSIANLPYMEAARSVGASDRRLMVHYILPNIFPTLLVYLTMRIGSSILIAASLSFLGLGVSPSTPEWGAMLNAAHDYVKSAPWTIVAPGLAILFTVLVFNLLGDGLRDALDPKIKA